MKRILIILMLTFSFAWNSFSQCPDFYTIFDSKTWQRNGDYIDVVFNVDATILAMENLDAVIDFGDGTIIHAWSGESPLTHRYSIYSLSSNLGSFFIDISMELTGSIWVEEYHPCPLDGSYELLETITFEEVSLGTFFANFYPNKSHCIVNESIKFSYKVESFDDDVNGLTYEIENMTEGGGKTGFINPSDLGIEQQISYTFTPTYAFNYEFAFKVYQYGMLLTEVFSQIAVSPPIDGGADIGDCDNVFNPDIRLQSTIDDNEISFVVKNYSSSEFNQQWATKYNMFGYYSTLFNGQWQNISKVNTVGKPSVNFSNELVERSKTTFNLPPPLAEKSIYTMELQFTCERIINGETGTYYNVVHLKEDVPIGDISSVVNHFDIDKKGGTIRIETYTNDCAAIELYNPQDRTDKLEWVEEVEINNGYINITTTKIMEPEGRTLVLKIYVNGYYSPMVGSSQKSSATSGFREVTLSQPGFISEPYSSDETVLCLDGNGDENSYYTFRYSERYGNIKGGALISPCIPFGMINDLAYSASYPTGTLTILTYDEDGNLVSTTVYNLKKYGCSSETDVNIENRNYNRISMSSFSNDVKLTGSTTVNRTAIVFGNNKIILKDGFKAIEKSIFHVAIEGCNSHKSASVDTISTNINEEESFVENLDFKIYPNPGSGIYNIDFMGCDPGIQDVAVYDLNGNLIKEVEFGERYVSKIDISDYPQGSYIVRIISNNKIHIAKIIKL